MKTKSRHPLYRRWKTMMERCYKEDHKQFKYYGGRGITVEERWHSFKNFIFDVDNFLENGHLLYQKGKWHLDKDKKGGKIYSLQNCSVLSPEENNKLLNDRLSRKVIAFNDKEKHSFKSVSEAARQLAIKRSNLQFYLRSGYACKVTGYCFKYETEKS